MENAINITSNGLVAITDLKLQAFLRALNPESFRGVNRVGNKVSFLFTNHKEFSSIVANYWRGEKFTVSPLAMSNNIDNGKSLIFGGS